MSDQPQTKDLKALLTQVENDWQELKKILRSQQIESPVLHKLSSHRQARENKAVLDETPEPQADPNDQPQIKKTSSMRIITPVEAEAIVQRTEQVHRDFEVLERLARVEKQNRRITILGSMFLTIVALGMAIFAYLLVHAHLWDKASFFRGAQAIVSAKPADSDSTEKKESAKHPEAGTYVGSETSNKYHLPDCKWAKTIAPERLVTFKSVEEAKEAGYKRCPVCKPPGSD